MIFHIQTDIQERKKLMLFLDGCVYAFPVCFRFAANVSKILRNVPRLSHGSV